MSFGFSSMNVTVTLVKNGFYRLVGVEECKEETVSANKSCESCLAIQAEENVSPREFCCCCYLRVGDIRGCLNGVRKV